MNTGQRHPFRFLANEERNRRYAGGNNAARSGGSFLEHRRMWRKASPAYRSGHAKLVKAGRIVVGDTLREDMSFPGAGSNFKSLQLFYNFQRAAFATNLRARCNMLPAEEPAHKGCRRDRFNLFAQ